MSEYTDKLRRKIEAFESAGLADMAAALRKTLANCEVNPEFEKAHRAAVADLKRFAGTLRYA